MKGKGFILLLCLAVGMGLYLYYGVEKASEKKKGQEEKESKLVEGNSSLLTHLELKTEKLALKIEKQKENWRLTSPVKDLASSSKMESLISSFEKFKKTKTILTAEEIQKNKSLLTQYELDPPKAHLIYKTSDQAHPSEFLLGKTNHSATGLYVQKKGGDVVLATLDLDTLATETLNDFREMKLITVEPHQFLEVEVNALGKKMKFKKETSGEWTMTPPPSLPLDQEVIRSFMDKISLIRANEFLADTPVLKSTPDIEIIVGFKEGVQDKRSSENDLRPQGAKIILTRQQKNKRDGGEAWFDYFAQSDKTELARIAQFHYENFIKKPEDFIKKKPETKAK